MHQISDDEALDYLLSALGRKGPAGFNVYFELEARYGKSLAETRVNFFMRTLEYHKLARQDPSDKIFRLTGKGKLILEWGGWLKYLEILAAAKHRDYLKRRGEVKAVEQKLDVESDDSKEEPTVEDETGSNTSNGVFLVASLFIVFIVMFALMYKRTRI